MTGEMLSVAKTPPPAAEGVSMTVPAGSKIFEDVFHLFKAQLVSGDLRPNDRLLPERELSQKLQVSRATLREVMRALSLLGVVEIRPGQGAFVRAPDISILQEFFGFFLAMQPTFYDDVFEARIAIECQAIRLACRAAGREDHLRLEAALRRIDSTAGNAETGAEADHQFHAAVVAASHNEVLKFLHAAIAEHLKRSHAERRRAAVSDPNVVAELGRAHRLVLEAIIEGDPDRAEAIHREHFTLAQRLAGGAAPTADQGA